MDINDPGCNNILGDPFCDIQPAVVAASLLGGGIIVVEQGSYNENIEITTANIRLRGEEATLDGTGLGGIGIHVMDTSGVEIRGFIVEKFDTGIVLDNVSHSRLRDMVIRLNDDFEDTVFPFSHDGLQLLGSDHNLIRNVFAHHNGHNGITLGEGSSNNILKENVSNDNGTNVIVSGGDFGCGIEIRNDENNNNSVTDNEILRNGWGILLGFGGAPGSTRNIIAKNDIHDNARVGIDVHDGSSDNLMIKNDATGNLGASDLRDDGDFDNTWIKNEGTRNF